MSNELIEKVIATTSLGTAPGKGDGLLSPTQSNRFIDYMWDATVLAGQVRTIKMKSDTQEVDRIAVGQRLLRGATEAVDDGLNVGVAFAKISMTTAKLRLDWELSTEALEDGIEGDALEDHIARLMSTQVAQDLEDYAINGDVDVQDDPLLKNGDGWSKRATRLGHVIDHAGGAADRTVWHKALKALPRRYRNRAGLKFFAGTGVIQDYMFTLQQTGGEFPAAEAFAAQGINQAVTPSGPAGFITGNAFGTPIQEVPMFDQNKAGDYSGASGNHSDVWLTYPQNLLWGVKREIQVYREFKPKKDTVEYTMYTRVGMQVENPDAFVVVKNIKESA